ncbi:LytTR family DNA-binding domain-containing protein [uncultured Clostridium sp.]|uniref:LytR/AlgR family response regulator transcription factor n=1 Tax=uncultured Clostridium sp. TaxID=59620 RepID=UPI002587720D|nr:LytTR family DNA-binding domain-containing protein [uncultured Clostridium sp.]
MIRIAICDDQDLFREMIKEKIFRVCRNENIKIKIDCYKSGNDLIKTLKKDNFVYDILFLDILMNEIDGIETAKEIRKFDNRMQIIFCTSFSEYILQGYEVEAIGYFIKGEDDTKLREILKRAIEKTNRIYDEYILINLKNSIRTIYLKDIEFIEISNRTLSIHTTNEIIDFNGKMQEMLDRLKDKNFILTHRSYLVNISKIKDITPTSVIVKSGKEILLSRLRSKLVREAYLEYIFLENRWK